VARAEFAGQRYGHAHKLQSMLLLKPLRIGNHLSKRRSQSRGDGLCRVQIWASFSAFQKANVRLVKAGFLGQSRAAEFLCLPLFLDNAGKGI